MDGFTDINGQSPIGNLREDSGINSEEWVMMHMKINLSKQIMPKVLITFLLLLSIVLPLIPAHGVLGDSLDGDSFTLALIPDSQNEVQYDPSVWENEMQWIVNNKTEDNIQAVIGEGDVTNDPTSTQMTEGQEGYNYIMSAGIPCIVDIGNHDYDTLNDYCNGSRVTTTFNAYFGTTWYRGESCYKGSESNTINGPLQPNTENSYFEISVGNYKYLIFALEYFPTPAAVAWAQGIINANPGYEVIVSTHAYLRPNSTLSQQDSTDGPIDYGLANSDAGQELWDDLINVNPSIIAVVSAHFIDGGYYATLNAQDNAGNWVAQVFNNFQMLDSDGDGYLGLLTINPTKSQISFQDYSTSLGTYYSPPTIMKYNPLLSSDATLSNLAINAGTLTPSVVSRKQLYNQKSCLKLFGQTYARQKVWGQSWLQSGILQWP